MVNYIELLNFKKSWSDTFKIKVSGVALGSYTGFVRSMNLNSIISEE